jgi:hypothetical protein
MQTRGEEKYCIIVIDDCTRYYYIYLLRDNDESLEIFKHYKNKIENQLDKKIKVIRNEESREYEAPFGEFYPQNDIIYQTTTPYLPKQNSIVEYKNRTLRK